MAKRRVLENAYVRVEIDHGWLAPSPDSPALVGYVRERFDRAVGEILRHVDNVKSAQAVVTTRDVCSLCGYTWELIEDEGDADQGLPACCDAAQAEAKRERAAAMAAGTED